MPGLKPSVITIGADQFFNPCIISERKGKKPEYSSLAEAFKDVINITEQLQCSSNKRCTFETPLSRYGVFKSNRGIDITEISKPLSLFDLQTLWMRIKRIFRPSADQLTLYKLKDELTAAVIRHDKKIIEDHNKTIRQLQSSASDSRSTSAINQNDLDNLQSIGVFAPENGVMLVKRYIRQLRLHDYANLKFHHNYDNESFVELMKMKLHIDNGCADQGYKDIFKALSARYEAEERQWHNQWLGKLDEMIDGGHYNEALKALFIIAGKINNLSAPALSDAVSALIKGGANPAMACLFVRDNDKFVNGYGYGPHAFIRVMLRDTPLEYIPDVVKALGAKSVLKKAVVDKLEALSGKKLPIQIIAQGAANPHVTASLAIHGVADSIVQHDRIRGKITHSKDIERVWIEQRTTRPDATALLIEESMRQLRLESALPWGGGQQDREAIDEIYRLIDTVQYSEALTLLLITAEKANDLSTVALGNTVSALIKAGANPAMACKAIRNECTLLDKYSYKVGGFISVIIRDTPVKYRAEVVAALDSKSSLKARFTRELERLSGYTFPIQITGTGVQHPRVKNPDSQGAGAQYTVAASAMQSNTLSGATTHREHLLRIWQQWSDAMQLIQVKNAQIEQAELSLHASVIIKTGLSKRQRLHRLGKVVDLLAQVAMVDIRRQEASMQQQLEDSYQDVIQLLLNDGNYAAGLVSLLQFIDLLGMKHLDASRIAIIKQQLDGIFTLLLDGGADPSMALNSLKNSAALANSGVFVRELYGSGRHSWLVAIIRHTRPEHRAAVAEALKSNYPIKYKFINELRNYSGQQQTLETWEKTPVSTRGKLRELFKF